MKASSGLTHWPRAGVALRLPPRRLAAEPGARCDLIAFAGAIAEPPRAVAWDTLASAVPRGTRVVLLVAAEDVTFVEADVPPLSGMRLREALPNLVEDRVVGDVATLHVALGGPVDGASSDGRTRALAVVDRAWLAAMQVHVVRAGLRVAAIVPDALAVPQETGAWSIAVSALGDELAAVLRRGPQAAWPLGDDESSAAALADAIWRGTAGGLRPTRLDLYAPAASKSRAKAIGEAVARATATPLHDAGGDPFVAWLEGGGASGRFGAPLSLFGADSGAAPSQTWRRWRLAAMLAVALLAVQVVGLQMRWAGLRAQASEQRREQATLLTSSFPDTKVVVDPPLQMERALASMRAQAGRNDPGDFGAMVTAMGRVFAALPSNAARGVDYEARALRVRLASALVGSPDVQQGLVSQAAQEGYALRFDPGANAQETVASLRPAGAAR